MFFNFNLYEICFKVILLVNYYILFMCSLVYVYGILMYVFLYIEIGYFK